jgi:hypothetical protein
MQLLMYLDRRSKTALFPDLTSFRRTASCCVATKSYGLLRELPATSKKQDSPNHGGFPSVLIATSLAISKQSTFLSHCKHRICVLDLCVDLFPTEVGKNDQAQESIPNQHILLAYRKASLIRHRKSQPTPQTKRHTQYISTFAYQTLKSKVLLSPNDMNCIPALQTFPSYSRKPALFGPVVSDFHKA